MFENILRVYNYLKERGLENPLVETLGFFNLLSDGALERADLLFPGDSNVGLQDILEKRKECMPFEYILGRVTFMGLQLYCTPDALIPRAETELLVSTAIDIFRAKTGSNSEATIIDVGTGSGSIAVALAINMTRSKIFASDISEKAIELAKRNVARYDLQDRVTLFCGDLFAPFAGFKFSQNVDMIVCNPPYIPTKSLERLPRDVIDHEPQLALDAGAFGIDFFRRLIREAVPFLKPRGALVFEIGAGQNKLVERLLTKNGNYDDIEYISDDTEIRVVSALKKDD